MQTGIIFIYSGTTMELPNFVKITDISKKSHRDVYGKDLDMYAIKYPKEKQGELLNFLRGSKVVQNWGL